MAAPAPPNIPPAPRRGDFVDFCGSIFHVLAVADGVALLRDIKRRRFEVAHLEFCVVVARALSETPDPQPNPNMEMIAVSDAAPFSPRDVEAARRATDEVYGNGCPLDVKAHSATAFFMSSRSLDDRRALLSAQYAREAAEARRLDEWERFKRALKSRNAMSRIADALDAAEARAGRVEAALADIKAGRRMEQEGTSR